MRSIWMLPALTIASIALLSAQTGSAPAKGSVEKISVHGKSLEGNLEGDSADRTVFVYLPPSYSSDRTRRYPVVVLLHGYGLTAERWLTFLDLSASADKNMAAGTVREMILVSPDAFTLYNGSMYSNSATTGDWEGYIAQDLVAYIDSHYRTLADRASRGLGGHSMGGYGTMRVGMKHPETFSILYAMSSCCLGANLTPNLQSIAALEAAKTPEEAKANRAAMTTMASAAAWSPNPANPPFFFDLPAKGGTVQPAIVAKWAANAPLAMVDQYVPNLKRYKAIALEVGLQDTLLTGNKTLDELLTLSGVKHTYETYEGNHTNHVKERFDQKVLPFFSNNLQF